MGSESIWRSRPVAGIVVALVGVLLMFLWLYFGSYLGGRWHDIGIRSITVVTEGYAPVDTTGLGPQLRDATYQQATLLINDFSDQAALWFRAAVVATAVSMGLASVTVLVLCYRLVRAAPFGRFMSWLVTGTGLLLLVGGGVASVAQARGTAEVISSVPGIHGARPRIFTGGWMFYFPESFNPLPIVLGLLFLLLAAVLSRGTRYYRDVKDLV